VSTAVAKDFSTLDDTQKKLSSSISMIVTLISFSMLFATLFLGYAVYRFTTDTWPPMGMEKVGLNLPTLSTIFILFSSLSYWVFEGFQNSKIPRAKVALVTTGLLGTSFLVSQLFLWEDIKAHGYFTGVGIYPSILYAFTWTHAAHIIMGMFGLLYMAIKFFGNKKNDLSLAIKNVGLFWHFLGLLWLIIYLTIFVF
jgi:cytochrome c oxidase subunit 3